MFYKFYNENYDGVIELDPQDMEHKIYAGGYVCIPTKADLNNMNVSEFVTYGEDETMTKENFDRHYLVSNLYEYTELRNVIERNVWNDTIDADDLKELELSITDIQKILLENKIDEFDTELITLPYWDGSNWRLLDIYDRWVDIDTSIDANCDGTSTIDSTERYELENMLCIANYWSNSLTDNEYRLYRTIENRYYLKEDSHWIGQLTNIFNIYTEIDKNDIIDLLKDKFNYDNEDIKEFIKENKLELTITA